MTDRLPDRLVVNASIIVSALIKRSFMLDLLLLLKEMGVGLFSPSFLLEELEEKKGRIIEFSKLTRADIDFLSGFVARRLSVVSKKEYEPFLGEAKGLFPEHPWDTPYFAASMKLSCPLWSDERLLKRQPKVRVLSTEELVEMLKSERLSRKP